MGIIIIGTIVGVCILAGLCSRMFLGDDNIVEEFAEEVIKEEVGISVDLSPNSPEVK